MPRSLMCVLGHRWEINSAAAIEDRACPVCGGKGYPLPDEGPPRPPVPDTEQFPEAAGGSDVSAAGRSETTIVEKGSPPADRPARAEWPYVEGYEILGELGRGGMGVVYKARQTALGRVVALKMLRGGAGADAEELARFRAEAEAVVRLKHPNIVQIHEVGQQDGRPFFSLEYVAGGSLSDRICDQPQPPRDSARLVETLARAIHYAHERGIIHRDLKPANILLQVEPKSEARNSKSEIRKPNQVLTGPREDPTPGSGPREVEFVSDFGFRVSDFSPADFCPKITDFGLAKVLDQAVGLTRSGVAMGTPSYMAPEQAEGRTKDVSPATDVYSLGAVLYELLTGRPPFQGVSAVEIVNKVVREDPEPPSRVQAGVPRDLETICLKCLEKDPHRRYASAEALAEDVRAFLAGEPIRARAAGAAERALKWARRRPGLAVLAGAGVLAAVALLIGGWLFDAVAVGAMAVVCLLLGAGWYSTRLRVALRQLAREHAAAQRHVERLHLLLETTHRLMSAPDLDTLLGLISRTTTRLANAERATVYLIDRTCKELWSRVALGENVGTIRLPLGVGIAGAVALSGETVNLPDAYADPRFNPEIDRRTGYRTRNLLTFPMRARDGRIIGVFQVLNKRGGPFTAEDVETLGALAASAAVAVERAQD
jgi:serine/threonine-protein kinase